jgi:uncharacterized membrane protein (UPF0182 family)
MRPVIVQDDDFPSPPRRAGGPPRFGLSWLIAIAVALLLGARTISGFVIEYAWWNEIGQLTTWIAMMTYGVAPYAVVAVVFFLALYLAFRQASRGSRVPRTVSHGFSSIALLAIAVLSLLLALALADPWVLVRYIGASKIAVDGWRDPSFQQPLSFYLFDLPLYHQALRLLIGLVAAMFLVYWIAARGSWLREQFEALGPNSSIDIRDLGFGELLESKLIRAAGAVGLLALAARFYLRRYTFLTEDHSFMVGMDYVAENVSLPLIWLAIGACTASAVLILMGRFRLPVLLVGLSILAPTLISRAVNWAHVRPNEISIQRPYIERHIAATRAAYGLSQRSREMEFAAKIGSPVDPAKHRALLDNVRLWDWQAFHDTVTQIQALRPYYVFADSDVDRYRLTDANGASRLRQVLLTPRELDVRQLPDARTRWINPHFIYTHGYGVVMAEANRITADGLPQLFIQDAPLQVKAGGLKVTRPEIYFGEAVHEPVFVRTAQPEFNYPSGSDNVHTRYEGSGGFPVGSFPMRLAAAVREGDWNILLTSYLTGESRMMIRRRVLTRLDSAAGFLEWDRDPYMVVTDEGRLVWMVDGYTTSNAHPYSRALRAGEFGEINYIRNAVKATVDAYDGAISIYVFDEQDPIIQAYRGLFPKLFLPASAMSANLREHARYPETFFRIQAEIYRTFHMTDPEAFYNKEDLWDLARTAGQDGGAQPASPTYLIATLPGSNTPEFLLMTPFTPRNKDNLIGLMTARCDGEHLGELVFLQLSKQELIFGPMQIKARINQDQNISKDLTLWNQQGSKVIRGQMLVLPLDKTFVYLEPIYLQAAQAPMPQLRKVAIATGSQIAYADTYEQALQQLAGFPAPESSTPNLAATPITPGSTPRAIPADRLDDARSRLRRYRELMAQGKFADAGKELEALDALLK